MRRIGTERRQIKIGGRKIIFKACKKGGIKVSERMVNYIATEAKLQEDKSEKHYLETGYYIGDGYRSWCCSKRKMW